jgi:asparagine synthase (glutamine-hydrolysing)
LLELGSNSSMCGIFATTRADLWTGLEPQVSRALCHRGPDASHHWVDVENNVLLVHTRLTIIGDDQAGLQPVLRPDLALTYNGEIYNYKTLATESARSASDTDVLADLLSAQAESALPLLRGMFAFVAWDRAHKKLIAVRDPFGIKPLYELRHKDGGSSFASEIPVLMMGRDSLDVDRTGILRYMVWGFTGPTQTVWEGVSKVRPGTALTLTLDRGRWRRETQAFDAWHPEEPAASFRAALEDSVAAHLVADTPVGVFLSGGVDSTLLAALARPRVEKLQTFCVSAPGHSHDESDIAERHAQMLGAVHETVRPGWSALSQAVVDFIERQGEPFGDPAVAPLTALAQAASQEVRVVLSGEGADEYVGGYARYGVSRLLPARARRHSRLVTGAAAGAVGRVRSDDARTRSLVAAMAGGGLLSHSALLGSELVALRSVGGSRWDDLVGEERLSWLVDAAGLSSLEAARSFDIDRELVDGFLEKTDRATMIASLEARVPYLDGHLRALQRDRAAYDRGKLQMRAVLSETLPEAQIPRRKRGLTLSLPPLLGELQEFEGYALRGGGLLGQVLSSRELSEVRRRCVKSDMTAFRVAALGVWESRFCA